MFLAGTRYSPIVACSTGFDNQILLVNVWEPKLGLVQINIGALTISSIHMSNDGNYLIVNQGNTEPVIKLFKVGSDLEPCP